MDIGISLSHSCLCAIGGCYATLFRKCGFPKICPSGAKSKVQDHIYSFTKTTVEILFLKVKPSLQKIKHCSDFYLLSLINRFSIWIWWWSIRASVILLSPTPALGQSEVSDTSIICPDKKSRLYVYNIYKLLHLFTWHSHQENTKKSVNKHQDVLSFCQFEPLSYLCRQQLYFADQTTTI